MQTKFRYYNLKKINLISCNLSAFTWYNMKAMKDKEKDKSFADLGM